MTKRLSGHFQCAQVSSGNCETMESGNKIAILTLNLSQPLGVIVTIKENFNVPKDEAICLKLAIFHVEMSNLPNSA